MDDMSKTNIIDFTVSTKTTTDNTISNKKIFTGKYTTTCFNIEEAMGNIDFPIHTFSHFNGQQDVKSYDIRYFMTKNIYDGSMRKASTGIPEDFDKDITTDLSNNNG